LFKNEGQFDMAFITGGTIGFGNVSSVEFASLSTSVSLGTPTSTTWSSRSTQTSSQWEFIGTGFGGFQSGIPNVGIVTSLNYTLDGTVRMSITGLSLDMAVFSPLLAAGNTEALMSLIFAADDTFTGGSGSDLFNGYGGNDVISGGDGNDILDGGDGNDTLSGDAGNDIVRSSSGGDTLDGGAGLDILELSNSTNVGLTFTNANLSSAVGVTLANGVIARNFEQFRFTGGTGNDVLLVEDVVTSTNSFYGGLGNDTLVWNMSGYSGNITMSYSAPGVGQVSISPARGIEFTGIERFNLVGGSGNDSLFGGIGDDTLDGGIGNDVLTDSSGLFTSMSSGNDVIQGGDGDDLISGTGGNNTLLGGDGADQIVSGGHLAPPPIPGPGANIDQTAAIDLIDGGAGIDELTIFRWNVTANIIVDFRQMSTQSGVTLVDGTVIRNVETLRAFSGGSGDDVVTIGSSSLGPKVFSGPNTTVRNYSIDLFTGVDRIIADFTDDFSGIRFLDQEFWWGASKVRLSAEQLEIKTGRGSDDLDGRFYTSCVIDAGDGHDKLRGSQGADTLLGGDGNDDIDITDGGADVVDGGSGFDIVKFSLQLILGPITLSVPNLSSTSGFWLPSSALLRNVESLNATLTNFNDTLVLSDAALSGKGHYFDAAGGSDRFIANFSATTDAIVFRPSSIYSNGLGSGSIGLQNFERYEVTTGSGNDTLEGTNGADYLNGGAGDDVIGGGNGADELIGGAGNDYVTARIGANVDGGSGLDKLVLEPYLFNAAVNIATADLASNTGIILGGGLIRNIESFTLYAGALSGSLNINSVLSGANSFYSLNSVTLLIADFSYASTGVSLLWAFGGAAFRISGQSHNLTLEGGFVFNVRSGSGDDTLVGADGNDSFNTSAGNDSLDGSSGNDLLVGGSGADKLIGGLGVDTSSYSSATAGVYVFIGDSGNWTGDATGDSFSSIENLTGSSFNDVLGMDGGNNVIDGGAGDDLLFGQGGADTLIGGTGFDTASYATATSGIYAFIGDWGSFTGDAQGDTYFSIEGIIGTNFNDIIGMDDFANTLAGGGGDDILYGEGGGDRLFGNDGFDTVSYAFAPSGVYVVFADLGNATGDAAGDSEFSSIESIVGSAFDDIIGMGDFNDTLAGGGGNDVLLGNGGGDKFFGNDGFDTVSYALAQSGVYIFFADLGNATGDARGDSEFSSIESIVGSNFNDIIGMGDFADTIIGGAGNDILLGMGGNDTLWGGSGNDFFAYTSTAFGNDTIRDFQDGLDRIDFSRVAGVNYASLAITSVAGGVQVGLGASSILIAGASIGQINQADFLFA
jgi:Ca2+-binding RTX toxin-like protein